MWATNYKPGSTDNTTSASMVSKQYCSHKWSLYLSMFLFYFITFYDFLWFFHCKYTWNRCPVFPELHSELHPIFYRSSLTIENLSFWPEVAAKWHVWFRQLGMEYRYLSLSDLGIKLWIMLWSWGSCDKFKVSCFKLNAQKDSIIHQLVGTKSSITFHFPYIFFFLSF